MRTTSIFIILSLLSISNLAQQMLPDGVSFFGQAAYNRPIDYVQSYEYSDVSARFKPGFSSAIGFQRKRKLLFCTSLKYTYTSGKSYGSDYGKTYSKKFTSEFYLGRLSADVLFKGLIGERKALSIGAGLLFGSCIYKNINGDYHSSGVTSGNGPYGYVFFSENYKLPASFFGKAYRGFVFDIAYMVKNNEKQQSCFSIGSRIAFINGIMPWVNGYLETEVYITYNFWKKRNPTTEEAKNPPGTTKTGKLKRWGRKQKEEPVN